MNLENELALRPFVPASDFEKSKRFYQSVGYRITFEDDAIAMLKLCSFSFILRNFYVKELAENFMLQLMVRNVDTWWERIDSGALIKTFGVKPPRAPEVQDWGMKVAFLFDPSGVLWHVAEAMF